MRSPLQVHHIIPTHHLGYQDNSPDNLTPPISVFFTRKPMSDSQREQIRQSVTEYHANRKRMMEV